jgi:hypothetical protein
VGNNEGGPAFQKPLHSVFDQLPPGSITRWAAEPVCTTNTNPRYQMTGGSFSAD